MYKRQEQQRTLEYYELQKRLQERPGDDRDLIEDETQKRPAPGAPQSEARVLINRVVTNASEVLSPAEIETVTKTKTSAAWNYTVRLPNGEIYNAPMQTPLAPQERLTATIGFSIPNTTGVKSYTVAVSVSSDAKLANNSFSTNVPVGE